MGWFLPVSQALLGFPRLPPLLHTTVQSKLYNSGNSRLPVPGELGFPTKGLFSTSTQASAAVGPRQLPPWVTWEILPTYLTQAVRGQ